MNIDHFGINISFRVISIISLILVNLCSCSLPGRRPTDPKTPEEQMLMARALEKSASQALMDLPYGTAIWVETSGLTQDHSFVGHVLEGWLSQQGLILCRNKEEATHLVRVIVQSIGPTQNTKIIGIPGGDANAGLLGIRLPEIALYKRDVQKGYARFYLDVYETATGKHVQTTKQYSNIVSYKNYTVLFFITWQETSIEDFPD